MFTLLNPQPGETIWEVGTGSGYLTFPVARAVGKHGKVVTTDISLENLTHVRTRNNVERLQIQTALLLPDSQVLPHEYAAQFDAVASIVTFHHYDNRKSETGETGRLAALKGFYDALKYGGRLVLADPSANTITLTYFNAIDDPKFCFPEGHPHDFMSMSRLIQLAEEIGFRKIHAEVKDVPWSFRNRQDAATFVHTIHNSQVEPDEALNHAAQILGLKESDNGVELGWQLFFLSAKK